MGGAQGRQGLSLYFIFLCARAPGFVAIVCWTPLECGSLQSQVTDTIVFFGLSDNPHTSVRLDMRKDFSKMNAPGGIKKKPTDQFAQQKKRERKTVKEKGLSDGTRGVEHRLNILYTYQQYCPASWLGCIRRSSLCHGTRSVRPPTLKPVRVQTFARHRGMPRTIAERAEI